MEPFLLLGEENVRWEHWEGSSGLAFLAFTSCLASESVSCEEAELIKVNLSQQEHMVLWPRPGRSPDTDAPPTLITIATLSDGGRQFGPEEASRQWNQRRK